MTRRSGLFLVAFCVLAFWQASARSQAGAAPVPTTPVPAQTGNNAESNAADPQFGKDRQKEPAEVRFEKDYLKAANKKRHESLKKDTDKLLELATELKESVDKTTEHTLSLEVIRKTEEIEKLAKSVREKMKNN